MPVGDFYEERESPEVCILSTVEFIYLFFDHLDQNYCPVKHVVLQTCQKYVEYILGTHYSPQYVAGYEVGPLG